MEKWVTFPYELTKAMQNSLRECLFQGTKEYIIHANVVWIPVLLEYAMKFKSVYS